MRSRPLVTMLMLALSIPLAGALAPGALAGNYSYPATYNGTAASGGTVEFDVSADGAGVTRFQVAQVLTTCGTLDATASGTFPISNESFSNGSPTAAGLRFNGTFPAVQQAQGTLSFRLVGFPSCTSQDVSWTATTSVAPRDVTPPQTKITSGPSGRTDDRKATFRFRSSEAGSSFQCKLDQKPWQGCRSPKTYRKLKVGKHTLKVRARDAAGNTDPTPAKRSWRVTSRG